MIGGANEERAVFAHRPLECACAGITLYPGTGTPDKACLFEIEGVPQGFRGQLPSMLRALIATGQDGLENRQCRLWSVNPCDQVSELRKRGVKIATLRLRGKPARWILRSQVREVLP